MKLEGSYYFKPLEFYSYLLNTDREEIKTALGDKMFFRSIVSVDNWKHKNYYYKDNKNQTYSLERTNLMGYLKDIYNFYSDSSAKDVPELAEKVVVSVYKANTYEKEERLKLIMRDKEMTDVSESFINKFLTPEKTYKDVTYGQMIIGTSKVSDNSVTIADDESLNEIEESIELTKQEVYSKEEELKKELEVLKKKQEEEIQKIRDKFYLTMSKAKLEIAGKIMPLMKEIEEMTDKFTVLESNLYRWLSYNGYNYDIKQLTKGISGKETENFVVWQKLRFLDEELPKLVLDPEVNRKVDFSDFKSLEKIMSEHKIVRDFFLPSEKGCIVFQLSRSNVNSRIGEVVKTNDKDPHHPWISFVETSYKVENWNKLGMFLKNGDNLYVLWLDKERINLSSDNLFLSKNSNEVTNVDYSELKDIEEVKDYKQGDTALSNIELMRNNYKKRREVYSKFSSRVYIVDIIQGIINNIPDILELEEGQDVVKALSNGHFGKIVFNNADGYLNYSKWKNFDELKEDIMKGYGSKSYSVGDPIFLMNYIEGKDNGRIDGSYEMMHLSDDATAGKGITKINLIDYKDTYYWTKELTEDMLEFYPSSKKYGLKPPYNSCRLLVYKNHTFRGESSIVRSNYVEDEKTIEGWMTSSLGKAPILVYSIQVVKETKRVDHPYKSNTRTIEITPYMDNDKVPNSMYLYNALESLKYPKRYRNGYNSLEEVQEHYPGVFIGEDGKYYYELEQSEIHKKVKEDKRLQELISLGFEYREDMYKRKEYIYVSGKKRWATSRANIVAGEDEFLSLKYITLEHVNYMITNSMPLPFNSPFSNSVAYLLEIRKWIINRDNKKKN